ncbi:MAG: dihydrolipoyl dehydrogenase [Alphaproteobacteria bacterium]|nr:dihydrolipoyl dehydrogenase [Alphaproteobacteria bacterium]
MAEPPYDLVVIGGGPGGYVAAIRGGQLGMRVACVEKRGSLGGTCLNVGCIPSKALLHSSELYAEVRHGLAGHGIVAGEVALDLATMMARKDKVVADLTKGIEFLLRKNKVDYVIGSGRIAARDAVAVSGGGGETTLATRRILIATGSEPMPLPGVSIDEKRIVSSTGALALPEVPRELVVIGGGYIGLELGSVWARLGAKVTVVELLERIVPGMDGDLAKQLQRVLQKQGLVFRLGQKVTGAKVKSGRVEVGLQPVKDGEATTLAADVVLLAIGRRPYTAGLGLEAVGIAVDNRGRIPVNERFETAAPGILAIGDVIAGPMLAHKAEEDGIACVECAAGQAGHVDYDRVPGVVYTWPEVAAVGRTEEDLKTAGVPYRVGKFPFSANSRARVNADTEGLVKILAHAETDAVLGVHIIGPDAGTLIAEAVLALEYGASAEDIARTCHAHPTLSEAVKEAALAVAERAMHV